MTSRDDEGIRSEDADAEDETREGEDERADDLDDDDSDDDEGDGLDDGGELDDDATARTAPEGALPEPARGRKRRLGPLLLGVGGGIWALVAVMRCDGPATEVPSLSVQTPDEVEAGTPDDDAPAPTPETEPAAPTDAPPPSAEPTSAGPRRPRPAPASWVATLEPRDVVQYTIRRGGSLENVANLFKIYHHEILALNPGIELSYELPPNTSVVVYRRKDGEVSESVALPSAGSLEGALPMVEGPGRELKAIPWKSWGSQTTVAILDHILTDWAERGPTVQPILVGNMASRNGGRLPPHSTHQSGRDVDLGYPQKLPPGEVLNWREMTAQNLDAAECWELLFLLASTGTVEVIYIDTSIQKLLHEHAVAKKLLGQAQLRDWLEYGSRGGNPLVQHVKGHTDHLHVRFRCQPHENRCKSRPRAG
jgi:murein endopeptidase